MVFLPPTKQSSLVLIQTPRFDVDGISNGDINAIIDVTSKSMKLEEENEVKVTIMSFQFTNPGVSPSVIAAAYTISNN